MKLHIAVMREFCLNKQTIVRLYRAKNPPDVLERQYLVCKQTI